MLKLTTPLLFALILSFSCVRNEPASEITQEMDLLRQPIIELAPFLYDKSAFNAQENHDLILASLAQLKDKSKQLESHPGVQQRAMLFTMEELQVQLEEAHTSFQRASKDVARWQLTSSLGLCLQCHSQSPGSYSLALTQEEVDKLPQDALNRADILFVLRDYDRAAQEYEKILTVTHSFDSELHRLYKSFNRLLFLYVRISQDFDRALDLIRKGQQAKNFPLTFRKQVEALQEFVDKQVFYRPVVSHLTDEELTIFLGDYRPSMRSISTETDLYTAEELLDLWLAGELFVRLENEKPPALRATILHTLALIDERASENIFYSLSNRYLEECIELVPHTPQALSCFQDLQERLMFSYSGSRGTDLPEDVEAHLLKLEKKASP